MHPGPNARVALYSHDSSGLGHIRRNLLIAGELSSHGHDVLLVSGSPEATVMARPPATDLVTLPALRKERDGGYRARHLSMGIEELLAMRRELLSSALVAFEPDLLIVDRHARGFLGELEPALDRLRDSHVVLGLRDVLDAPDRVRREWAVQRTGEALASWYDEVWLYGDAALYEPLRAAGVASPVPVVPTGYLVADRPAPPVADAPLPVGTGPFALCMVGGGSDGEELASRVLEAPLPAGLHLLVVTGPQMAAAARGRLDALARGRSEVTITDFIHDPAPILRRARAAIVMGGYNTICEALASETPVLVVPRDRPRLEQTVRAQALASAGLLDVAAPDRASGRHIGRWLAAAVAAPRPRRIDVDLGGLRTVAERARGLLLPAAAGAAPTSPTGAHPLAFITTDPDHRGVTRAAV